MGTVTDDVTYAGRLFTEDELVATALKAQEMCAAGPWIPVAEKPPVTGETYLCQAGPIVAMMCFQGGKWWVKTGDSTRKTDWAVTRYAEIRARAWGPGSEP